MPTGRDTLRGLPGSEVVVDVHLNPVELRDQSLATAVQIHVRHALRSPVTGFTIVNAMTWDARDVIVVPITEAPA